MKVKKAAPKTRIATVKRASTEPIQTSFAEVVSLIEQARQRAFQAVNRELVGLYWQIGKYISGKLETAEWGEGVVDRLARRNAARISGDLNS